MQAQAGKTSKSAFTPAGKKGWHESCLANPHVPSLRDVPAAFHPLLPNPMKTLSAGTFPPDKTLHRKYRIERGGQKLRTTSRSLFLSFLTSREKFGDGRNTFRVSSCSVVFFFCSGRCGDSSTALRKVLSTAALAKSSGAQYLSECRASCHVETPSRFMPGNQWAPLLASETDLEIQARLSLRS